MKVSNLLVSHVKTAAVTFLVTASVVTAISQTTTPGTTRTAIDNTETARISRLETAVVNLQKDLKTTQADLATAQKGLQEEIGAHPAGWSKAFATFNNIKKYDDNKVAFSYFTRP